MRKAYKYVDTRQYIRLPAVYLIRYKPLEEEELKNMNLSTTEDISAGGVAFVAREELTPSTMIELEISFPAANHPIKVLAKVVRVEPKKRADIYKIAAQFIKINEEDKKAIDEYVKEMVGEEDSPDKWWWRKI